MIKLLAFLSVLTLFSCSSERLVQYHYQKALKHGLKLITDSDTIRVVSIDSVAYYLNDTIRYEKVITSKDTIIYFKNIYVPKTKWQTRIEYRYKTQLVKQDVLKYKYIYKDSKKAQKVQKDELEFIPLGVYFWSWFIFYFKIT
jgi:hypothetical protein